ncbi:MAG: GTPase [Halioglobus sp.]
MSVFPFSKKITRLEHMVSDTPLKLKIPVQDLPAFTLFPLDADAARTWTQSLPVTNTRSVAQQLRQAISDLNHVKVSPEIRYDILEMLRPNLEVALSNLTKRFLNQPLVMPEEPRQMAELANSLHSVFTTGYTIVAIEAIQQRESIQSTNPAKLTCEAIQRALTFAGRKILQTFQLFQPIELHGWLTLHQLYALADSQQLASFPVANPLSGGKTITATYLQGLMLGCCKPNQLGQSDIAALYRGLQHWSELVQMANPHSGSGLFVVDLDSDQPALYSALYTNSLEPHFRYIDTTALIKHLEQLQQSEGQQDINFHQDTRLPANMLDHVIESLGTMSLRNFNRATSNTPLWVAIGLSSSHYHVAGERIFENVLFGDDYIPPPPDRVPTNRFLLPAEKGDMWQQANPEEDYSAPEQAHRDKVAENIEHQVEVDELTRAELLLDQDVQLPPEVRYPMYKVQLANASPGGYCLEWTAELPGDIRAGDIISLKEEHNKNWVIAVSRWVSNLENARTLIGLELLSPRAMPYGARIHQKTGDKTPPMRVLLLPEIKLVGQPHTLITPRAGFRERQKVTLISATEEYSIQLQRQVAATGSFAQFDFRYIRELGDVLAEDKAGHLGSYDSVWSKI